MRETTSNERAMSLIRALVHGDSGIGKTTSVLTLPEKQTYVAVSERGLVPLRGRAYAVGVLEQWADLRELIVKFRQPVELAGGPAKVLVLDSLTECGEFCKQDIVQNARPKMMAERTGGKGTVPRGIYDEQMTQEDWGLYVQRMSSFIGALCRLPIHVVATALSSWNENKVTGEVVQTPDLNGKIAWEVPAYFDCVFHMEAVKDTEGAAVRVWRTANNGRCLAKDATAALAELEAPNWSDVFRKILGANGKPKIVAKPRKQEAAA